MDLATNKYHSRAKLLIGITLIVLSLAQTLILYPFDFEQLVVSRRFMEDAFISLKIAQNISAGIGETFDGVHPTNGYQPLWVWINVPTFMLFKDPVNAALAVLAISIILFHATLALWLYVLKKKLEWLTFTAVAIVPALFPYFKLGIINGLETPLFLFVFTIASIFIGKNLAREKIRPTLGIVAGILLAITFYARLDSFIFSFAIGFIVLFGLRNHSLSERLKFLIAAAITQLTLVMPFLIRNIIVHGGLMPISGAVKQWYLSSYFVTTTSYFASDEWIGPSFHYMRFLTSGIPIEKSWFHAIVLIFMCLLSIALAIYFSRKKSYILRIIAIYNVLHLFFMVFIYRENRIYTSYYFAVEAAFLSIAIVTAFAIWVERIRNNNILPLAFSLLILTAAILQSSRSSIIDSWSGDDFSRSRYRAALWARENTPADAKIGAFWAGTFSYVSGKTVINLDGICNSRAFFENFVKSGSIADYIREERIDYIIDYFPEIEIVEGARIEFDTSQKRGWTSSAISPTMAELSSELVPIIKFGNAYYVLSTKREISLEESIRDARDLFR